MRALGLTLLILSLACTQSTVEEEVTLEDIHVEVLDVDQALTALTEVEEDRYATIAGVLSSALETTPALRVEASDPQLASIRARLEQTYSAVDRIENHLATEAAGPASSVPVALPATEVIQTGTYPLSWRQSATQAEGLRLLQTCLSPRLDASRGIATEQISVESLVREIQELTRIQDPTLAIYYTGALMACWR